MAALTIEPNEVQAAEYGQRERGRTFEAFNAGALLYYDSVLKAWGKSSAILTLAASGVDTKLGVALSTSLQAGANVAIQRDGDIMLGASAGVVVGKSYMLGAVAGSLYPSTDMQITYYRTLIGIGAANGVLRLSDFASGILPESVLNDSLIKWLFASQVTDSTPLVSPIIDRLGYDEVTFFVLTGTLTDADAIFVVLLEHGDVANLSDAAAVPDAEMISQTIGVAPETAASFNFGDDGEVRKMGYASPTPKRYLRLTVTPTGNVGAADIFGYCDLGAATSTPITQTAA